MSLDDDLLTNIHRRMPELEALLAEVLDPLTYEDRLYRYYYQSWKVYELQGLTREIARLLVAIAPGGRPFCAAFQELLDAGAGEVRFEAAHNQAWTQHTRVFVEAFLHAKFFLEMAVTYGRHLAAPPPTGLPFGWAACYVSMISASCDSTGPLLEEYPMPEKNPSVLLLDHALKIAFGIACDLTRAETLEGIALAYAEAGQAARAATILRRIWQMARGLPKPSDRAWQLRWLAEACIQANLEELALAVAADLVQASARASVAVELAQHHIRAGRTQPATVRLAQALELARAAQQSGEDASFAVREIAETAVELGLIDHAVQVASTLEPDWLAVQALCAVAVRCAQTWHHELVAAIFDRALHRIAALASEADRAFRLAELVKSRVHGGLLDHTPVLRVAETIELPEARARVWLAMATSDVDLGDHDRTLAAVDHVCAMARTIQADEATANVLAAVADLYRQVGVQEWAAEVRCLACQRADAIERPHLRAEALVAIAASYAKAGESEAAKRLLAQAVAPLDPDQRAYWDVSARVDLAEACHRIGQPALGRAWLTQALARAPQVSDLHKRTTLLELIAHAARDLEDDDLAWQAAQGLGKGRIKRLDARAFHLALIAGGLVRRGDFGRALQVAETIPDGADKTSAFDDIATAYIDAGCYQEALHTVQQIKNPDSRAWATVWAFIRIGRQLGERSLGDRHEDSTQPLLHVLVGSVTRKPPAHLHTRTEA